LGDVFVGISDSGAEGSSDRWVICVHCVWCWRVDGRVVSGDCGHVDDCKGIILQLTCGNEGEAAELENWCGAMWCGDGGRFWDVCWSWFSGIADHWIGDVCWNDWWFTEGTDNRYRF